MINDYFRELNNNNNWWDEDYIDYSDIEDFEINFDYYKELDKDFYENKETE